ncbi:MAG: hypothetical protein Q9162_001702 [Coniocarpon cinnabarinum]
MSVPNSNAKKSPPPPLPPPRYIETVGRDGKELVHRPFEGENASPGSGSGSGSIRSGSSLLGGSANPAKQYTGPQKRVDLEIGTNKGGKESAGGDKEVRVPDMGAVMDYNNNLRGERNLGQRSHERSSAAYDKRILAEFTNQPTAISSEQEPSSPKSFKDFGSPLWPLRRRSDAAAAADSPRWPSSALSPSFHNLHSPLSDSDPEWRAGSRPPTSSHSNHPNNPSEHPLNSPRSIQEPNMSLDHQSAIADESHLSELNINDKRPLNADEQKNGQKRRAHSPSTVSIDPNLRNQEDGVRRDHPQVARVQNQEPPSLASSASSNMQSGSYQSSYGFTPGSSATSYSSQQPPSSLSQAQQQTGQQQAAPVGLPDNPKDATNGAALPPAPQQSHQQMGPPPIHSRTISTGIARPPGVFICECCPKKPKKFEKEEELR